MKFAPFKLSGDDGRNSYYQAGFWLDPHLISLKLYFRNNIALDDNKKLTLVVSLDTYSTKGDGARVDTSDIAAEIIAAYPNYKDKLIIRYVGDSKTPTVFLKVRVFAKNTSEFTWKLAPKYGPFDVLYSTVGTFNKEYIDPRSLQNEDGQQITETFALGEAYEKAIADRMLALQKQFWGKTPSFLPITPDYGISFGNFALIGETDIVASLTSVISSSSQRNLKDTDRDLYSLYLRGNHTLAKWYFGKKSALQKVNKDRVNQYLDTDRKNLAKVMQFFGGDTSFLGKKR